MRKQFTILVILIFAFGLFNIKFSNYYSYAETITDESQIPKVISVFPTTMRVGETFEVFGENFNYSSYYNGGNITSEVEIALTPVPNYYNPNCSRSIGKILSFSDTKIVVKLECSTPGEAAVCVNYGDSIDSTENKGNISDCYGPRFTIKEACDWNCGDWSNEGCPKSGTMTETRICIKPVGCESLDTPMPAISNITRCIPSNPTCTPNDYTCTDWSSCSIMGKQYRDCTKTSVCDGQLPATSQSCTYVPMCTSFNYSSWSECSADGKQTRSVISKYPTNCEDGESPKITQSCTYTPSCTEDTWQCGNWGTCSPQGVQTRSCKRTYDCPSEETAAPATSQYCEAPNRPQYQTPSEDLGIENQDSIIKATVKLICPVNRTMASQGSGTVVDSRGTILTNKHVIEGTPGCLVGFIDKYNDEPYFGDRQIADIKKISADADIAVLKLRNPNNTTVTAIDISRGNSGNLRLGNQITTYGYPAKFGTKITYTSGDFSGVDGNYLKTTAIIEHGNSGGGAYLKNGTFVGMPTAVVKGSLNSLGYILSINKINSWLNNSTLAYGNDNSNNYSRVSSILENIDLNTLGSLDLFIPDSGTAKQTVPSTSIKKDNQKVLKEKTLASIVASLGVRKSPSSKAKVIWAIKKGKWYAITGGRADWYQIKISNKLSGWVMKKYVKTKN